MYLPFIYKNPIILSLLKIIKLHHKYFDNFNMLSKN